MPTEARDIGLTLLLTGAVAAMVYACDPWTGAGQGNSYPLIGEHADVSCEGCPEITQGIGLLPTACERCHLDDKPDPHPDDPCEECHTPMGWLDIQVDHDFFPLEDAHELSPCTTCHGEDGYFTLDPACSSCHEADRPDDHFDGADCEPCHTPTDWDDADFDHDEYFPIPHEGEGDCGDCHLNDDGYETFSCIDCHEHNQDDMDDEHDEEGDYVWASWACLDCHPDGEEDR